MSRDLTQTPTTPSAQDVPPARDWVQLLAKYRDPSAWRSAFELGVSLAPYLGLWALAWWSLSYSYLLTLLIAIINGLFLVRLFAIQHDCGHRAFFRNTKVGDWIGRGLGALTLTPYDVWRRTHSIHHSSHGNLSKRGMGDIYTLTVAEYQALSRLGQLHYRVYRHPLVLFGLGPAYIFYLQNRLPVGLMGDGWKYWTSAMSTNIVIAAILGVIIWFGGLMPVLLIFIPTTLVAASAGLWLFYVQHQFEHTHWRNEDDWKLHDAAFEGSSHYKLPQPLQWLTANIGIHHVHHLYSRIPFYRLTEVLRDYPVLREAQQLTLRQSIGCIKLQLWDEGSQRLLSQAQVKALK
jgi:acyl-lipid omega-6 desaturase (Delta-12 desaturase)